MSPIVPDHRHGFVGKETVDRGLDEPFVERDADGFVVIPPGEREPGQEG